ncbi:arylamine N-acetyltransferase family protein [Kitasatospora mediocidica]|uniref:arylamine N-acetyltransferase family protein n=1 Tax=Kitasatospora mediocidica TaxID=58352 RepID=UPI000AC31C0A|nr:arylamine N-acetyltransferase [Kitasatospora mediocidica]
MPAGSRSLPWEDYLRRLGYTGPLEPTVACLHALVSAHLLAVPYEMLESLDGVLPALEHPEIFDKVVRRGRGGTCMETTPLFGRFLRELGFEVRLVAGQMWRVSGEWWPHWDHLVLVVEAEGESWLVDVGFLMLSPLAPLRISGTTLEQGGWRFRVVVEDGLRTVLCAGADGVWAPVYRFADQPLEIADYAWIIDYHLTAEDSPLAGAVLCSRTLADGKLVLLGENFVRARGGRREVEFLADSAAAGKALGEVLHGHPQLLAGAVGAWEKARANRRAGQRKII